MTSFPRPNTDYACILAHKTLIGNRLGVKNGSDIFERQLEFLTAVLFSAKTPLLMDKKLPQMRQFFV
jgi:hypothetical protein